MIGNTWIVYLLNITSPPVSSTVPHTIVAAVVGALVFGGLFLMLIFTLFHYGFLVRRTVPREPGPRSGTGLSSSSFSRSRIQPAVQLPTQARANRIIREPEAGLPPSSRTFADAPLASAVEYLPQYEAQQAPPSYELSRSDIGGVSAAPCSSSASSVMFGGDAPPYSAVGLVV